MSTSGRINKSTTKFVPKRKTGVPSSQRASSTTPSISSGTPRVAAHSGALLQIDEFSLSSRGGEEEENRVIHEEAEPDEFVVPRPPAPKVAPPSSSFGPSDPSLAFSSQPASTAGTSFGSSFGPSDPSLTARPPSSPAPPSPQRAKSPSKGTAFSFSTGPPVRSSSPIASTSKAVASTSKPAASTSKAAKKGTAEPRTQREIEEEAGKEVEEKQRKKELAKQEREENKAAKAAGGEGAEKEKEKGSGKAPPKPRAKGKGKGKAKAAEGDEVDADGDSTMAPPPKPKRKRAPPKPKVVVTGSGSEEEGVPALKRFKHNVGRKKATKTDLEVFGSHSPSGSEAGSDDEEEEEDEERGSDDLTPRPRKKKFRKPKKTEVPRVTVDAETTTMFELANPRDVIGGRVSERFVVLQEQAQKKKTARKEARIKMKERAARRARGEETESEEEDGDKEKVESVAGSERGTPAPRRGSPALLGAVAMAIGRGDLEDSQGEEADKGEKAEKEDDEDDDSDDVGELVETQYAPQMRIVDGQLVIDDASLEVDRSLDTRLGHVGPREVVEESAKDRMVNSATWGKQKPTAKWIKADCDTFYEALSQFGTDFEMIAGLFPHRTRRQIKAKFNREDKLNPQAITNALVRRKDIDLETYAKITGQDLSGPVPHDPYEAVQKRREEEEAKERENGGPFFKKQEEEGEEDEEVAEKLKEVEEEEEEEEDPDVAELEEEARQAALDKEIEEAEEEERRQAKKGKKKA